MSDRTPDEAAQLRQQLQMLSQRIAKQDAMLRSTSGWLMACYAIYYTENEARITFSWHQTTVYLLPGNFRVKFN